MRFPKHIQQKLPKKPHVIDVKLWNGVTVGPIYTNSNGVFEGLIVGGQDGIDSGALYFHEHEIKAIRIRSGLRGLLKLNRWINWTIET